MGAVIRSMTHNEAGFTNQVLQFARLHGWRTAHFRPARVAQKDGTVSWRTAVQGDGKGFPDLVLVRGTVCIFAELKIGTRKPTPEQEMWLQDLTKTPNPTFLWTQEDWGQIEEVLGGPRQ